MNQISKAIHESDEDLIKSLDAFNDGFNVGKAFVPFDIRSFVHSRDRKILEAAKEMTREMFYAYNEKEADFSANQRSLKLRNDIINAFDEVPHYIIVSSVGNSDEPYSNRLSTFVEEVNRKIGDGYAPLGGVCADGYGGYGFFQAMIKE